MGLESATWHTQSDDDGRRHDHCVLPIHRRWRRRVGGLSARTGRLLSHKRTLIAAGLAVVTLTACAQVTIERTGNLVTVAANGSVLGYSAENIVNRAHDVREHVCSKKAYVPPAGKKSSDEFDGVRLYGLWSFDELRKDVRETVEGAKAIVDLFGSHSYRATLECSNPLEAKTINLLTHRRKRPSQYVPRHPLRQPDLRHRATAP